MWTRWSLRGRAQCLRGQIGVNESPDIEWLRLGLRARRHRNERIRRPLAHGGGSAQPARVPCIAGGSGLSPEVLRQTVRERLAGGRLPLAGSVSVARRGTGRTCDVCGAPITRETVEREVEHASESHGFAHEECYRIWREESRRADSPDPTR